MYFSKYLDLITASASMETNSTIKEMQSDGKKVFNLSTGEPDFDLHEILKENLENSVRNSFSHYTNKMGIKPLRKSILEWHKLEKKLSIDNIIVAPGGKYALFVTINSMLDPKDEVIVLKPYWVSYPEIVKLCGGKPIFVNYNEDLSFDVNDLQKKINKKTKAIIVNNPNNPSGYILSQKEMDVLNEISLENDIFLIADEIYSKIVYDKFYSFKSYLKTNSNIVIINGVSKSLACTGLRIGYIITSKQIIKNINKVHQHIATCAGSLEQKALSQLTKQEYISITDKYRNIYLQRRNSIFQKVNNNNKLILPKGTFYILLDIRKNYENSVEASRNLLKEFRIGTVPGRAYGIDDFVRISFAVDESIINKAINLINKNNLI